MVDDTPAEIAIEPLTMTALPPKPSVSVAIICFNYGRFLPECLDSCLAQTVPADEIVVVNDGSTDNSAEVLDGYAARFPVIRAIHQANGGICSATNAALAACSGDVVVLLDADDTMVPQRIEMVLAAFRRLVDGHHPGWVHHLMTRFSDTRPDLGMAPYYPAGKGPEGWLAAEALHAASSPVLSLTSALAFRKEVLAAIGPLDSDRLMYQDLQLCTAATFLSAAAWIPEPLTRYRVHGSSATAGSMVSLDQVKATRNRASRFDRWLRTQLEKISPGAASLWRPLDDQGGYLWLTFLERWLSGAGKDLQLLLKVLKHPDTRNAPRQHRVYYYGSVVLPRAWFVSYSRLIFGSNPIKTTLRRLLRRG
ncbi:glycosyltransferase [Variovorax sp. J2P1-59]|uniref:glycosyltransferase family 2 protein n=1 Tax=Variovorax flavidus TaxID=3053501 RepID=UPI00257677FF|nr:glycosyltransferase family 2 protein [Variovorax sp. J2P1-59]MDM0073197.1 glycosyltransferase [Variovorax sp. J2P1-59]